MLTRSGRTYATGRVIHGQLVLQASATVPSGSYTLAVVTNSGGHRHTRRYTLSVS